jgi:hypothetical protein
VLKNLRLSDINIPRNRRSPLKGRIASVAQSMREVGQLNPITVNLDGHRLIAGRTRYEAAKLLDWKDICCNVVDFDKLHARLAEIDENIERSNLSTLEEAQALKERKAIYLELHPETAEHVAGGRGNRTAAGAAAVTTPSFVANASEMTGKAERTIRENVAIGENIAPAAAKALKDSEVADCKCQLQDLVKLEPEQQVEVAKAIKSGEAESVRDAKRLLGVQDPPKPKRSSNGKPKRRATEKEATPADEAKAQIKIWADTIGRWLGGSPSIDSYRSQFPGKQGDAVVKAATSLFENLKNWQKAIK